MRSKDATAAARVAPIVDAKVKAVTRQSSGAPQEAIRNLFTARAGLR
jgi:hypothetical protein